MKYLFAALLVFSLTSLGAQDYKTSAGLRIGSYYGLTIKHFIKSDRALEGILLTRNGGANFTGLYEIHTPAFSAERLKAYGGIGGHISVFDRDNNRWYWYRGNGNREGVFFGDNSQLAIGVDMILGLEYTINTLPFNISIDWKPALNIIGDSGLSTNQIALSFRFVFK